MALTLSFLGGAGTVTGSKYAVEHDNHRIMIDCGLFQGFKALRLKNWERFPVEPRLLEAVILSHAHLDHSGYLPLLVKRGFSGPVFCSRATADLCALLLPDAGHLQEKDAEFANRHSFSKHKPALPLYTEGDARTALEQLRPIAFDQERNLPGGGHVRLRRAGHILGAASVALKWADRTIVFSGDLGRYGDATMVDPASVGYADYLLVESTYGNRVHDKRDPADALDEIVSETVRRGGTVVIPAFAVGRAQSLLFHFSQLKAQGRLSNIPIYLDSPMALDASEIFCRDFKDHKLSEIECRRSCEVAHYVRSVDESKALTANAAPKVIISASGMATGGRVLHHLKRYASNARNTILFAGFQAGGTRGAAMIAGADSIKIHGEYLPVRAAVRNLDMLSAHADADEILRWLRGFKAAPTMTYIVHGELVASDALRHRIEEELGWRCRVPDHNQQRIDMSEGPDWGSHSHEGHAANSVRARRIGLDTQYEAVVFMHKECDVCRSEGFSAHTRVLLGNGVKQVIATLYQITGDLIAPNEAALSESAWTRLALKPGDFITVSHPAPLDSLSHVRSRIYGHDLAEASLYAIMQDIVDGKYSDIHLSSFITACAARALDHKEILALTHAMVEVGERLSWPAGTVVDKHSVGGLPGNRTTPIIVAIVASLGLMMPKTSSRAITSPAGTADTMETMAPVELDMPSIRRVVEREGGCIVWGGAVKLSPADDILIRVERALDLDTEGQLIASVLSKKIAAGATHLVIDLPVGATAKVRSAEQAQALLRGLASIAETFGLRSKIVLTDGAQPVGRGIGPALEARDLLAVLRCQPNAPQDLRQRAVALAGALLELAGAASEGSGRILADKALEDGRAWIKFQSICEAQGGMRIPPTSHHRRPLTSERTGQVLAIDNRRIARLAKLAGAPEDKAAGVDLHVSLDDTVTAGQPLCTIHADSLGELDYASGYAAANRDLILVGDS